MKKQSYSFLVIGKTAEQKSDFKRYVGLGQSTIVALNPTKEELEKIYGRETNTTPEYYGTDEATNTKWARFDFIVKTIPEACKGIEILTHAVFTVRNEMYTKRDGSKVRVIDNYGNVVWMDTEAAKNHEKALTAAGNPAKIAEYRIARKGEPELIDFLRKFVNTPDAFEYVNGVWGLKKLKHENELSKEEAENDEVLTYERCMMAFDKDDFEKFFKGDVSGLWAVIKDRMNINKSLAVTLLYGVRTNDEGKQFQTVCTGHDMCLRKVYKESSIAKLEKDLAGAKASGMYANTDFRVQELQEYSVEPTNLNTPAPSESAVEMPWD